MTTCTHNGTANGTCPICRFEPFVRNHYFDGKFMVARDFTDEQRYYVDKQRHHNARLHGWGVVCGLKVKQHQNEACRDRFVCIEPGTAIDCCGHEIVITQEECIDITTLAAIKTLKEKNDTATHTLQICVKYKDCPTEYVPVLYDECGCDETKCAPNRILESYEFDIIVDPKPGDTPIHIPKLEWEHTLNIAHASRVAVHEVSKRLYVMSADAPGIVYQLDIATHTTITSHNLPVKVLALTISNNGERLYVVAEPVAPATERQLYVLNTTQPGLPAVQATPLTIPSSAGNNVVLAVEPGGRLLALIGNAAGDLRRWDVDIDTQATPATSVVVASLGANLTALALSGDGAVAYAAGASRSIQSVTIATGTKTTITDILPTSAQASALALVKSTRPDLLAVADKNGNNFHLVAPSPASLVGTVTLDHLPVAIAVSPGGHWAYVLEQDGVVKQSYVQAVNIHAVQQHLPTVATPKFTVSDPAQQLVMVEAGRRLYIPFTGDMNLPASGGVAILDISEEACEEILWRHLEGCSHCDVPNCVALATITEYKLGTKIQDAAIDNRRGRRVLASTEILQEWIECLSEHPAGGPGVPGPQGPPGPNGLPGPKGDPGPGLEAGLTRIIDTSWSHNTRGVSKDQRITTYGGLAFVSLLPNMPDGQPFHPDLVPLIENDVTLGVPGFVIAFSHPVQVYNAAWQVPANKPISLIDGDHIFEVKTRPPSGGVVVFTPTLLLSVILSGQVIPITWKSLPGNGGIDWKTIQETPGPTARGIAMIFSGLPRPKETPLTHLPPRWMPSNTFETLAAANELWMTLRGDFILDKDGRAIDAEFVRAAFPTGDHDAGSPYGIQGGTFDSWFWILRTGQQSPPNNANEPRTHLARSFIPGMTESLANRIDAARREKAFSTITDFRKRAKITDDEWNILKDRILVKPLEE